LKLDIKSYKLNKFIDLNQNWKKYINLILLNSKFLIKNDT
jgi:hypothetical protein